MTIKLSRAALFAAAVFGASAVSSTASAYTFATANCTLNSDGWCIGGSYMNGYRNAVINSANFGAGGTASTAVTFNQLAAVNAATLAGANGFVSSWWSDSQSASSVAAVVGFFLSGGDLFLLQDDTSHDAIGAALGLSANGSIGTVSNGASPLTNGLFGIATDITQTGNTGSLSASAITATNGSIGSINSAGQITSAYWAAGQYAVGAGKLVILADVDMISDYGTATYAPINSNGRFALNTTAFLVNNVAAVPEPATWAMMMVGFGLVAGAARYRRKAFKASFA